MRRRRRLAPLPALLLTALASLPARGEMVSGTVEFDPTAGFWRYSYTIDNTAGTQLIDSASLIISPTPGAPAILDDLTAPAGWEVVALANGSRGDGIGFVAHGNADVVAPGATLSGFSFGSSPPTTDTSANSILDTSKGPVFPPNHVPVPTTVPEPASLALLAIGGAGTVLARRMEKPPVATGGVAG